MTKKATSLPWLPLLSLLPAITFLGFILGTAFYEFKIWPYQPLKEAYDAAQAWQKKLKPIDRYKTDFFGPAPRKESGIFRYNKEKAYNGYTLFTSSHEQKALLMSMDGKIVHEWQIPFSKVWTSSPPHIKLPTPDDLIVLAKAHVYPNGDLLLLYQSMNDTPYGYGLAKVDKNSQVIWKYSKNVHHDVTVGGDAKIYTLTQELVKDKTNWYDDTITVLSADGKELKRVSVAKAFRNSDFSQVIAKVNHWDPLHTNSVQVLDEKIASQFPLFKKGQVIISVRNPEIIAVVDLDTEKVVWATTGGWRQQHDADLLPNGNILLFDNKGHIGEGGRSRVMEINPNTMETVWQYSGKKDDIFYSAVASSQQRLPNGNTLITQSCYGRIFEVTPNGEVIWEFISPFRVPHDAQLAGTVYQAQRFSPDFFQFQMSK